MAWGVADVAERFYGMERDLRLFARELCDVKYWHLLRFSLLNDFIVPKCVQFGPAHPDVTAARTADKPQGKVAGAMSRLCDRIRFDPMFSFGRADVLFALEPRQAHLSSGEACSLMLDFFIDQVPSAAVLQYRPYVKMPPGRRVFRVSVCEHEEEKCRRAFWRRHAGLTAKEASFIADNVRETFGIEVDRDLLGGLVCAILLRRQVQLRRFRSWLQRLRVKCVVTSVHYNLSNLILAEAAHALGLPVVELQHGTIFPSHAAYNLPVNGSVYSPDYLFAWGDFWEKGLRNYPLKSVVCTGYPYFDHHLGECPRVAGDGVRRRILFVSQGTIGAHLAKVAVFLSERLPPDRFSLRYKLHPSETRTWRSNYPELACGRVEVVEDTARNIYSCFAECDVVIGVYSTSVVEGLAWGLEAFSCRWIPGADGLRAFADAGLLRYVESEQELLSALRDAPAGQRSPVDVGRLWVSGAAQNIVRALHEIVSGGRV